MTPEARTPFVFPLMNTFEVWYDFGKSWMRTKTEPASREIFATAMRITLGDFE